MRALAVALSLLLPVALATNAVAGPGFQANVTSFSTRLPLIHINTKGKGIEKNIDTAASVTIQDGNLNRSTDLLRSAPAYRAKIEMRGNASSSWAKKQYDLELVDAAGEEVKASLLGMPAHHKWILAAPYSDRSFIRNSFAFELARSLGDGNGNEWWAPHTKAIELFLNGRYQGIYTLTEKIDDSKNRLNLGKTNWADPYKSPFMVKVEKVPRDERVADMWFETAYGTSVNYSWPKPKTFAKQRSKDARSVKLLQHHVQLTMYNFETAVKRIKDGDYQSYRRIVDLNSVQNFILAHEIYRNIDGFRRSIYLNYKDGKVHLGPVWDFDLGWANLNALSQMRSRGWQVGHNWYIDGNNEIFWFRTMLKDPSFQRDLARRYLTMRKAGGPLSTGVLMRKIDAMAAEHRGGPVERNFTVWKINGTRSDGIVMWLTPRISSPFSYSGHVAWLKAWLLDRLEWMDDHIYEIGGEVAEARADTLVMRPWLD